MAKLRQRPAAGALVTLVLAGCVVLEDPRDGVYRTEIVREVLAPCWMQKARAQVLAAELEGKPLGVTPEELYAFLRESQQWAWSEAVAILLPTIRDANDATRERTYEAMLATCMVEGGIPEGCSVVKAPAIFGSGLTLACSDG